MYGFLAVTSRMKLRSFGKGYFLPRKLLLSKAMVVNVAETSGQDSGRQG
jgi:hypothetical protein